MIIPPWWLELVVTKVTDGNVADVRGNQAEYVSAREEGPCSGFLGPLMDDAAWLRSKQEVG